MTIIPHSMTGEQLESRVDRFFREQRIGALLKQANFSKTFGFSCVFVLRFVFMLVFGRKNMYQTLQGEALGKTRPGKDVVYQFLNCYRYNWRKFLLLLSSRIVRNQLEPLTCQEREKVLILDDSVFSRNRSKAVELLARVHDHVSNAYVRGFRMLTLGWSDGNTFVPLCFSLLSSAKEKNRLKGMDNRIDKRTVGSPAGRKASDQPPRS